MAAKNFTSPSNVVPFPGCKIPSIPTQSKRKQTKAGDSDCYELLQRLLTRTDLMGLVTIAICEDGHHILSVRGVAREHPEYAIPDVNKVLLKLTLALK